MVENIGINAGKVWMQLDKKQARMNVRDLRQKIKLTERDTLIAIGWLAKEGKISLNQEGRDYFVELI